MKKALTGFLCLLVLFFSAKAQPDLYAPISGGGTNGAGTIIKFQPATNSVTTLQNFSMPAGANPCGSLVQASDGKFYGMTNAGGTNGLGVIFSFDPVSGDYLVLWNFESGTGASPNGSLIQGSDGNLYGMTTYTYGGSTGNGVIFSFDPIGITYSVLWNFTGATNIHPFGSLLQASDGKLYGMTTNKGGPYYGVIFSFDPVNTTYTILKYFDFTSGAWPYGHLIQATDGMLYGMTWSGGSGANGEIFSLDPVSGIYTMLKGFIKTNGSSPYGSFMQASDGKLYGMTRLGGSSNVGVLFSFDPVSTTLSVLKNFDSASGSNPEGSLMQASDGKLYGVTSAGGSNGKGVIFSWDPGSFSYAKLNDLDSSTGSNPQYENGFIELLKGGDSSCTVTAAVSPRTAVSTNMLKVTVQPNPSHQYFTLTVQSGSDKPVNVNITDLSGRIVEVKNGVSAGGTLILGTNYRPGTYVCELRQGNDRVILQLIKQAN